MAIKLRNPSDLIGAVPHMIGEWPDDSLVAVLVHPDGTGPFTRLKFPSSATPTGLAEAAQDIFLRDPAAVQAVLVLYSADERFAAQALEEIEATIDLPVFDAIVVTPQRWVSQKTLDSGPIEETRYSVAATELVGQGSAYAPDQPPAVPEPSEESYRLLSRAAEAVDADYFDPEALLRPWEEAVTTGVPEGEEALYLLAAGLGEVDLRDALPHLVARGFEAAVEAFRRSRAGTPLGRDAQGVLFGAGPAPDWRCVDRLDEALRRIASIPSTYVRAEALALMGWIRWVKGSGTAASRYLTEALRANPNHRLAQLLLEAITHAGATQWATDPRRSYRPAPTE